ncbi:MAG: aminoacetone oxidase family FAD-binding enzyme [Sulfurovaceae bacterium]|nr:aminoacetone oxidase family FAD-binding enzyme [Sulfurovaceae bacterium]
MSTLLNNKKNQKILIIEHNSEVAKKILISGGGKCNITNEKVNSNNYLGEQRFIANTLKRFTQHELLFWLNERGLIPELRQKNQYFCKTSAKEIVNVLTQNILKEQLELNTVVQRVQKVDALFEVMTDRGTFQAKKVIVASGGLSFPKIGATSIGYNIATSFGHTVNRLSTGLVGFTVQPKQFFFKELAGISTEVEITVGKKIAKGALLFAHKGISGPAVLDASLYWDKGTISINFLPTINIKLIMNSKRKISNLLGLPSRLSKVLLVELNLEDKIAKQMTSEEWNLLSLLKTYTFAPAGTFGYGKAEVTKGGISTAEIDMHSMMSKKVENLYFVGEVLDVTGELGGYNFQWAFSSAFVCSEAIRVN